MSNRSRKHAHQRARKGQVLRSFDQLVEQRQGRVTSADRPLRMRPFRTGYFWLWRPEELG